MGFLLIALLIALHAWPNIAIVRMLRRGRAQPRSWVLLLVAWLAGAGLGVWGGFFFEYLPKTGLRVFGAPVPVGCLVLEGPPGQEQWVDYVTPVPFVLAASNVVILSLLAGCSAGLILWLVRCGITPPPG